MVGVEVVREHSNDEDEGVQRAVDCPGTDQPLKKTWYVNPFIRANIAMHCYQKWFDVLLLLPWKLLLAIDSYVYTFDKQLGGKGKILDITF